MTKILNEHEKAFLVEFAELLKKYDAEVFVTSGYRRQDQIAIYSCAKYTAGEMTVPCMDIETEQFCMDFHDLLLLAGTDEETE